MIDKELKTLQQERYMTDSSQFKFFRSILPFLKIYCSKRDLYVRANGKIWNNMLVLFKHLVCISIDSLIITYIARIDHFQWILQNAVDRRWKEVVKMDRESSPMNANWVRTKELLKDSEWKKHVESFETLLH